MHKYICCKCLGGKPKYWRLLPAPMSKCDKCKEIAEAFSKDLAKAYIEQYGYEKKGFFNERC